MGVTRRPVKARAKEVKRGIGWCWDCSVAKASVRCKTCQDSTQVCGRMALELEAVALRG